MEWIKTKDMLPPKHEGHILFIEKCWQDSCSIQYGMFWDNHFISDLDGERYKIEDVPYWTRIPEVPDDIWSLEGTGLL